MYAAIAVFLKDDCVSASFLSADQVAVFDRINGAWTPVFSFPVCLNEEAGLSALRAELRKVIAQLGSCRIVAGSGISGVAYSEFDRNGFRIFEISEHGPEMFDAIMDDIKAAEEAGAEEGGSPAVPVETDTPGVFFLDLVRLQQECPAVSSKQALREFLSGTPFYELHLLCSHMPPWLENGAYEITTEPGPDGKTAAVVRKKQCGGGTRC